MDNNKLKKVASVARQCQVLRRMVTLLMSEESEELQGYSAEAWEDAVAVDNNVCCLEAAQRALDEATKALLDVQATIPEFSEIVAAFEADKKEFDNPVEFNMLVTDCLLEMYDDGRIDSKQLVRVLKATKQMEF